MTTAREAEIFALELERCGGDRAALQARWLAQLQEMLGRPGRRAGESLRPKSVRNLVSSTYRKALVARFGEASVENRTCFFPHYLEKALDKPAQIARRLGSEQLHAFSEDAAEELVCQAEELVAKHATIEDPAVLITALVLLTGRRPVEFASSDFEVRGDGLVMSGMAKARGEKALETFPVTLAGSTPALVDAAIDRLCDLMSATGRHPRRIEHETKPVINRKMSPYTRASRTPLVRTFGWPCLSLLPTYKIRNLWLAKLGDAIPEHERDATDEDLGADLMGHGSGETTRSYMTLRLAPDAEAEFTLADLQDPEGDPVAAWALFRHPTPVQAERAQAVADALVDDFRLYGVLRTAQEQAEIRKRTLAAAGLDKLEPDVPARAARSPVEADPDRNRVRVPAGPDPVSEAPVAAPAAPSTAEGWRRVAEALDSVFDPSPATVATGEGWRWLETVLTALQPRLGAATPAETLEAALRFLATGLESGTLKVGEDGLEVTAPQAPEEAPPPKVGGRFLVAKAIDEAFKWNAKAKTEGEKLWIGPTLLSRATGANKLLIYRMLVERGEELDAYHRGLGLTSPLHNRTARMPDGGKTVETFCDHFRELERRVDGNVH